MKHWKWIASTGLVAVLGIAYVTAETSQELQGVQGKIKAGGNPRGLIFELFDADKNGEITRAELTQADMAFDTLDINKDGVLSAADFPRRPHGRRMAGLLGARIAEAADADQNGEVTEAEWQALVATIETDADGAIVRESLHEVLGIDRPVDRDRGPNPDAARPAPTADDLNAMFARLDRDANGVLEASELVPNRPGRRDRGERRGPDARHRSGPRGPMAQADADDNGEVSAAEWQVMFNELDKDGSGALTQDELRPGPAGADRKMRREFRQR